MNTTINQNSLIKKLKENKKKSIIILVGIIIILLLLLFIKKNKFYADDVFWYLTDNNTVLHLSSTKPDNPNYKRGQNNFFRYHSDQISGKHHSVNTGNIIFYKSKPFSKFPDHEHPIQFEDAIKSPVFYVNSIVIDNKISPKYISFSLMKNVTTIENMNLLDTSNMTYFMSMFSDCRNLVSVDLSSFNTTNIIGVHNMFSGCTSLNTIDLSNFNTNNITNMAYMFQNCIGLKVIDISNFDTSKCTNISGMFSNCENLETIYCNNSFINNITSDYGKIMFEGCEKLVGGYGTRYSQDKDTIDYAVVDSSYQNGYFTRNGETYKRPVSGVISGLPQKQSEYRDDGHFYINEKMQKSSWVYYVTYYYHVDSAGNIEKNKWIEQRYVGADGRMYRGRQTPDGTFVGDDGLAVNVSQDLTNSLTVEAAEPDSWYKTQSGLWYYFENDRTTTKKGWFTDARDNQTYYFDPSTGIMAVGWTIINGDKYYFNESHDNENNWYETGDGFYESYGKKTKAYGSMFKNEITPDGSQVDGYGRYVQGGDTLVNEGVNELSDNTDLASQVSKAKCVTEYSKDTMVEQMDTVTFGSYPQSDVSGNSKEPIEWIVLEKQGNKALLLSKYVLDFYENAIGPTWEESPIRKFANEEFFNNSFSEYEKRKIIEIENVNNGNPAWQTAIQNATKDKIFLLSIEELCKYFDKGELKEIVVFPNGGIRGFEMGVNVKTSYTKYPLDKKISHTRDLFIRRGIQFEEDDINYIKSELVYECRTSGRRDGTLCKVSEKDGNMVINLEGSSPYVHFRPAVWVRLD